MGIETHVKRCESRLLDSTHLLHNFNGTIISVFLKTENWFSLLSVHAIIVTMICGLIWMSIVRYWIRDGKVEYTEIGSPDSEALKTGIKRSKLWKSTLGVTFGFPGIQTGFSPYFSFRESLSHPKHIFSLKKCGYILMGSNLALGYLKLSYGESRNCFLNLNYAFSPVFVHESLEKVTTFEKIQTNDL